MTDHWDEVTDQNDERNGGGELHFPEPITARA